MKKQILKNNIASVLSIIPFNFFRRIAEKKLIVPLYHLVTDNPLPHIKHLYKPRSFKDFTKDVEFFMRNFKILTTGDFHSLINNAGSINRGGFMLTFDDGLREIYEIVAPYLFRKGIPAIFFINNNFIGNKDMFYRFKASILIEEISKRPDNSITKKLSSLLKKNNNTRKEICKEILKLGYEDREILDKIAGILQIDFKQYLSDNKPYMDLEQIKELQRMGFIIGAHTQEHRSLAGLSSDEVINQVAKSMNGIIQELLPPYRYFAFPFTDFGVCKDAIDRLHYHPDPVVDASFGTSGLKPVIISGHIQRIPMEISDNSASGIIKTEILFYLLKKIIFYRLASRTPTRRNIT